MYHNGSDQDPKRGLSRRFILTSAILPGSAVPLPSELATSGMVTRSKTQVLQSAICFCMDDLKLYSKNEQEQVGELKIVKQFHDDIRIEFGLEKCAIASFKKGRLTSTGNIVIDKDTEIQELGQEGVNKYLGVDKSDGIQHSKMKEKIRKNITGE